MTRRLQFALLRRCAALLALSLLLRGLPHWDRPQFSFRMPEALSSGKTGQAAPSEPPAAEQPGRRLPLLRFRDVPADEPADLPEAQIQPAPLPDFSAMDAGSIVIHGNCTLDYDRAALLAAPLPAAATAEGPQVLIVQTHSTEAYEPEPGWEYEETEPYRTLDPNYSVIRVGAEIAGVLESCGISVIHDQTINDYPSYSGSYDRMAETIQNYLAAYPTIRMVVDVHRDAIETASGAMGGTAKNGTARVMLVSGTDEGGLYHPHWQQNLSCALKLERLLESESPGTSRGIALVTQRYNQHLTPLSLLAEFGAAGDTLLEALSAARSFGKSLARLLS